MNKNSNDIFSKPKTDKKKNPKLKYFILAFSLFIVILALFSAFLFMRSVDFDLNNIVDRTTAEEPSNSQNEPQKTYSVSELTGKSEYLFILTDDSSKPNFGFIISSDFDSKRISVRCIDLRAPLDGGLTYADIYEKSFINGLKERISADYSVSVKKYIICTPTQFKQILSSFGGITVEVPKAVDYKSDEFNVILDKGTQKLSEEYVYKYLAVSDYSEKARIMCDIINSAFTPENAEKSDSLFKIFVNNCNTDISVIDYSNALEKVKIYSNASDKFYPSVAE